MTDCLELEQVILGQHTDALRADTAEHELLFITAPMPALKPAFQQENEEELHTSFEEAISERHFAISLRNSRVSGPLSRETRSHQALAQPALNTSSIQPKRATFKRWQIGAIVTCLALTLMLFGFDLMGLLLLHTR